MEWRRRLCKSAYVSLKKTFKLSYVVSLCTECAKCSECAEFGALSCCTCSSVVVQTQHEYFFVLASHISVPLNANFTPSRGNWVVEPWES